MNKDYWTEAEVLEVFQLDSAFLNELQKEEIICADCLEDPPGKMFSSQELEKLRLAKLLVEEMEVNLSGVEIILHMRRHMLEMRRQFDAILEDLRDQFKANWEAHGQLRS